MKSTISTRKVEVVDFCFQQEKDKKSGYSPMVSICNAYNYFGESLAESANLLCLLRPFSFNNPYLFKFFPKGFKMEEKKYLSMLLMLLTILSKSGLTFAAALPPEKQRGIPPFVGQELTAWTLTTNPLPAVTLWLLERYRQLPVLSRILEGPTDQIVALAISPDGNHLVTGSMDGNMEYANRSSGARIGRAC